MCPRSYIGQTTTTEAESAAQASGDLVDNSGESPRYKHQCNKGTDCSQCRIGSEIDPHQDSDAIGLRLCVDTAIQRRDEDIKNESALQGNESTALGSLFQNMKGNPMTEYLGLSYDPGSPYHALTSLVPLDQCILAIMWEILEQPLHSSILPLPNVESETRLTKFAVLLRSAALYQARLESVRIFISRITN